ncbi:MAG: c-type cytochrome [Rhodospirillales bacterium]|nr:c-type cytochrome [Rhodospirillales bacterium]
MSKRTLITAFIAFLGLAVVACSTSVSTTAPEKAGANSILRGGMLYDNWFATLGAEKPSATHSQWPASNTKKKGNVTWRCKSCHGWDYMGKDGAYASGSYASGITGIRASDGADAAQVVALLRGETHGFTDAMIPDAELANIAAFVTQGQFELDKYIDRASKKSNGNAVRGKSYYDSICANCHGSDGKEMNFKTADNPEFLGTLANGNPWEAINKIRHGQPDSQMPALGNFPLKDLNDIVAYIQTLPAK